jgi:hypothetical protein
MLTPESGCRPIDLVELGANRTRNEIDHGKRKDYQGHVSKEVEKRWPHAT